MTAPEHVGFQRVKRNWNWYQHSSCRSILSRDEAQCWFDWDSLFFCQLKREGEMSLTKGILPRPHRPLSTVLRKLREWQNPVLAHPLANLSDDEIDKALSRAGLARQDLFTSSNAIAQYRTKMACMLAALGIKVDEAVTEHWTSLKVADGNCSRCAETGRCYRWLEWGRPNTAPTVFCPNASFFLSVVAEQKEHRLRDCM